MTTERPMTLVSGCGMLCGETEVHPVINAGTLYG